MSSKKIIYKNLILSGGGIKIYSLIGSFYLLNKYNILNNIKNYIGCSSGTIALLFLIFNEKPSNIILFLKEISETILKNENTVINLINNLGITQGKEFINTLDTFLNNKLNINKITFLEFYKKTNKNFTCVVTNINTMKIDYLNYINYPNMHVSEAIKASCSLPLLFTPSVFLKIYINKNNKNNIYYLSKTDINYIGYKNENENENEIKVSPFKSEINKLYFIIYFFQKWILVVMNDTPIIIDNKIISNQSYLLNIGNIIKFGKNKCKIKILNELSFSDGGIIENYSIKLADKLKGNTLGINYKISKKYIQNDNSNIFFFFKNLFFGMADELLYFQNIKFNKKKKKKNKNIIISINNKINFIEITPTKMIIEYLILAGYKETKKFLIKNKKLLNIEL